jgi:two-component system, cell cycle sensor histidine kinase and response regulator CckA
MLNVAFLDILAAVAFLVAFLLVFTSRSHPAKGPPRIFLMFAFAIYVFVGISNVLEHADITPALDPLEDYAEMMFVPVFLMFLYSMVVSRESARRQEAINELRDSERRYRDLVENIDIGIVLIDAQHRIVMSNNAQGEMFDKSAEALIGKLCYEEFAKRDTVCQDCPGAKAMKVGEKRELEMACVRDNGSQLDVRTQAFPYLGADGEVTGFLAVIEDFSDRRHMETQLVAAQKMEAVGTMAGGVAHDFRNLLQVILSYSEILLQDDRKEAIERAEITEIQNAAKRGAELTNQLLTFSRKTESNQRPIDLNQELTKTVQLLERTIPKMVRIKLMLSGDAGSVMADPTQLEQVVLNLANNAKDSMEQGGTLTIETERIMLDERDLQNRPEIGPGVYVLLKVSDAGTGIDEAMKAHIFEPFFTTKEVGKGTGLGLSTVYGIVKSHDGHIVCESEIGQGTTFTVYLPAVKRGPDPVEQLRSETVSSGSGTVLVIDDEVSVVNMARAFLTRLGYTVLSAGSGESGLVLFESEQTSIDVIILDLGMPGMGGERCLEELVRMDAGVRVIVASGYSDPQQGKRLSDLGARSFIQKPYSLALLSSEVRAAMTYDA